LAKLDTIYIILNAQNGLNFELEAANFCACRSEFVSKEITAISMINPQPLLIKIKVNSFLRSQVGMAKSLKMWNC
jgi:hypothetical protein